MHAVAELEEMESMGQQVHSELWKVGYFAPQKTAASDVDYKYYVQKSLIMIRGTATIAVFAPTK